MFQEPRHGRLRLALIKRLESMLTLVRRQLRLAAEPHAVGLGAGAAVRA